MDKATKKIVSIESLVLTKFLKLNETTTFENAVMHIGMRNDNVAVVVNDQEKPVGILRGRELLKALVDKQSKSSSINEIMLPNPPAVNCDHSVREVATLMVKNHLSHLPFMKNGLLQGVIHWEGVQKALLDNYVTIDDRNHELANKLTYKDDYLGVVSHDIRTPLSVISLCCDYLKSGSSQKTLTDDQKSFVERISRNSENAINMVSDILDVVRLEKTFDLNYTEVDVDQFLGEVISNLQVIANEKKIEVVVECEEHIRVSMDKKRIVHVLENLVNNAVKFSPSEKKVFVSASCEERSGENYLIFTVKDEGSGIRKEDEGKIFGEFQQLEQGVAKTLGMGLGLAIAKKFVALHRGFMEVDGGWQDGATFRAMIPGARIGKNAFDQDKNRDGRTRVLLVEDDDSIREYFQEELELANYEVIAAHDGEEGIHSYFRYRPDLIISDIRMANVDGLELLARVRMTDKSIPFILCSGYYPGLSDDLAASEFKADHMIEKPVTADDLIATISKFVQKVKTAS